MECVFSSLDNTNAGCIDSSMVSGFYYHYAVITDDTEGLFSWSNELTVYAEYLIEVPHTVTGTISVPSARSICFAPQGNMAFATSFTDAQIHRINTTTDQVIDTYQHSSEYLDDCCMDENGSYLFTVWYANTDYASSVIVTDPGTSQLVKIISLPGDNARGICSIPGRNEIYVCMAGSNCVQVIDAGTLQLSGEIDTSAYNTRSACGHPSGETAYVSRTNSDDIAVVDTDLMEVTDSLPAGLNSPSSICIRPDGEYLYYAGYGSKVGVIRVSDGIFMGVVQMPGYTGEICMLQSGSHAYVALSNGIGIIDTELNELVYLIEVPGVGDFIDIAASPDGTKLYATAYAADIYIIE
jgi:DNA-binding beta-propeller fold protein YncE